MSSLFNFLKTKTRIDYNEVRETERIRSSELQASIALSLETEIGSEEYSVEYEYPDSSFELDSKELRKMYLSLTSKHKYFFLLVLRDYSIWSGDWLAKFIFLELVDLSIKKNITESGYILSVVTCSENRFLYTLSEQLWDRRQRQILSSVLNDDLSCKEGKKSWEWLFLNIFSLIGITKFRRSEPTKVQRHKGYRDHGSLGSEFSRTLRQQSSDYSILERELELQRANLRKRRQWYHGWGLLD
jgi:hypothetical protein